jgi:hypothetical protein
MAASGESPDGFVEIAGDPTLTKTVVLPLRVRLPLEGEMRSGLFWFCVFGWFGILGLVIMFVALTLFLAEPTSPFSVVFGICIGAVAFLFIANTVLYWIDLARPPPMLVLDASGICDRRATRQPVAWADVARGRIIFARGDITGMLFSLRRPVVARRNPFRVGAAHYLFRRGADTLVVPLAFFRNRRTIAYVAMALVRRHGGDVTT